MANRHQKVIIAKPPRDFNTLLEAYAFRGVPLVNVQEFMRRLTAVLSADLQGYNRLMSDDSEQEYFTGRNNDLPKKEHFRSIFSF